MHVCSETSIWGGDKRFRTKMTHYVAEILEGTTDEQKIMYYNNITFDAL